jgi:hypothetical protein
METSPDELAPALHELRERGTSVRFPVGGAPAVVEMRNPTSEIQSLPPSLCDLLATGECDGELRFYGVVADLDLPYPLLASCVKLGMRISIWKEPRQLF